MSIRELPENDAALVALLLACNPDGLAGVSLRGLPGPGRDAWLARFRELLDADRPWQKIPVGVADDRLLGGLDFAATIRASRPIYTRGLMESADGGVVVIAMAERLRDSTAAMVADAMDHRRVIVERDGLRREYATRFCVVALDEGIEDDEQLPEALSDRLAFRVMLKGLRPGDLDLDGWSGDDVRNVSRRVRGVRIRDKLLESFSAAASVLGIASLRAELFLLQVAKTAAALQGYRAVREEHVQLAARLVLPQRARCLPAPPEQQATEDSAPEENSESREKSANAMPDDVLVDSVVAALPPDVLERLAQATRGATRTAGGRGGPATRSKLRGRPVGVVASDRVNGSRLNILATLKAAAPWQTVRGGGAGKQLRLRPTDLHVTRYEDRTETTTIFVVDASGSQAAQRLAEVKGAIELLLNDCYVRRDHVALVAFRRDGAEVLLDPTRALARVKRSLTALPGGGGTPLAAGLDVARELAVNVVRQGRSPAIVLLTDGRANIARDGTPGAERAGHDAREAAKLYRLEGLDSILVDASRRPRPRARELADAMGATYIPLPNADADRISATVQGSMGR